MWRRKSANVEQLIEPWFRREDSGRAPETSQDWQPQTQLPEHGTQSGRAEHGASSTTLR